MSKEFEEIALKILEKVEVLDERTKNTDKVIQEVVLKKIDSLETEVKENKKDIQSLRTENKKILKSIEHLNNKFTEFDFEINTKIDTLFDAFTVNKEKDLVHEEKIISLDAKVFNHDIRISNLEDKVLTA